MKEEYKAGPTNRNCPNQMSARNMPRSVANQDG